MNLSKEFVKRLAELKSGELTRLRQCAGCSLDASLQGFDLFTGLWWPLRQASPQAPERRSAWLVAKLYGSFPLPVREGCCLPQILGRAEPRDEFGHKHFRRRFDELLLAPLAQLEPHLRWALAVVTDECRAGRTPGLDWVQLLEDLRTWDGGAADERHIRDKWARIYLDSAR